ncbi:hypothetical protein AB205_0017900 [Aquarana catesbeiana]|uniref:Uncharacterized protein n=1 Tax=Aquarana catesbeiana TaxID=8400 RepID=A0A2G9P4X5_AQUCT|nr:hypothetical protein AB205_0017900 [Aquarana catesbeiana]
MFYSFKHACLTQKRLLVLSNIKMLYNKFVGLFKNPFLMHM